MADAVGHIRLSQGTDPEVLTIPSTSRVVVNRYDGDLDADGD